MSKSNESPEDRLIARYFRPLATAAGAFGLIDDAAALTPPPGCDLVLTTAAKGARPLGFLLSVALPAGFGEAWLGAFAAGLADDAARYGCPLYGGDTDHTPGPITISITMIGSVPEGTMVRRAGANPGDRVFVSGTIGDAALGVMVRKSGKWKLSERQRQHLVSRNRETRWRRPCAPMLLRRWISPMASLAILRNFAELQGWRLTSILRGSRSRKRPKQ